MRMLYIAGIVLIGWGAAAAESAKVSPGCEKIVAVLDQGGGGLSAEEVAKRTNTDVETVRGCTDQWRSTMKDAGAAKGAKATGQEMPAGCAKIVAVLDQGGGLSADEVAAKTNTDVETVRSCTDQWRRTMPK